MITRIIGGGVSTLDTFDNATATAAANTAVSITLNASANHRHVIHHIQWSYSAAPTGGKVTITVGGVTKFDIDVTAAGPGEIGLELVGDVNSAVVVTLAAGSGTVVGKLNAQYSTERDLP